MIAMRQYRLGFFLCIAGALAACDGASTAALPASESPVAPVVAAAPAATPQVSAVPACADADFNAFLKRFEASADAQRAATADPLAISALDPDAQPEPAPVTRQVPLADVAFPVMANAATREAEGSETRIESRGENARDVFVALPDSGAQVHYEFEMQACWTLVSVNDQSM